MQTPDSRLGELFITEFSGEVQVSEFSSVVSSETLECCTADEEQQIAAALRREHNAIVQKKWMEAASQRDQYINVRQRSIAAATVLATGSVERVAVRPRYESRRDTKVS